MMREKYDVKELLEVVAAFHKAAEVYEEIFEDGKVNWLDIPRAMKLWGSVKDAFDNVSAVILEIKDIDATEAALVGAAVFAAVKKWIGVLKPPVPVK